MSIYKIADLSIKMDCRGKIMQKQCRPYWTGQNIRPDFEINTRDEDIKGAVTFNPKLNCDEAEYILSGFSFSNMLLDFNGFCLHSSAISFDNRALLFSAPCGTGKSTHTRLWQEYFGKEKVEIINDDKPALRFSENEFYVYGTPWSGKEDISSNIKVPLKAIFFIEQAGRNYISRLNNKEALIMLLYQSMRPKENKERMNKLLTLLEELINKTEIYKMGCTISNEAVELIYDNVFKGKGDIG